MKNDYQYERLFRALGDGHRLTILKQLAQREMNAGEILETVDVVQSTLSHHMKTLCESGLVKPRKSGKWTCYTLNRHALEAAAGYLQQLSTYTGEESREEAAEDKKQLAYPEVKEAGPEVVEAIDIDYAASVKPERPAEEKKKLTKEKGRDKQDKDKGKGKVKDKDKSKPKAKDKSRKKQKRQKDLQ